MPDEVIGFHAQQALEKLLKAALAYAGAAPPRIHNLGELMAQLKDVGLSAPVSADEARALIPWAVEFRYDDVLDERLDRTASREAVEKMRAWVDDLLGRSTASPHGATGYAGAMDLGEPVSYEALTRGTPVYSSDERQIGKVSHVLADEGEDVFDGIVIDEHAFGEGHRFVDADDVREIFERGVLLRLDGAGCEQLPKPSANPAVMHDDPAEPSSGLRHQRLRRAWDLISGNY